MDYNKHARKINPKTDIKPLVAHQANADLTRSHLSGCKVLALGCWTGQYEQLISEHCAMLVGLDMFLEPLRVVDKHAVGVKPVQGTVCQLPVASDSFDVVVSWGVIEHLPSGTEEQMIREIWRVLKNGGHLWLNTPADNPLSRLFDPALWLVGHRHYSVNQLKQFFGESITIDREFLAGGLFYVLYTNVQLVCKHLMGVSLRLNRFEQFLIRRHVGGFAMQYVVGRCSKQAGDNPAPL